MASRTRSGPVGRGRGARLIALVAGIQLAIGFGLLVAVVGGWLSLGGVDAEAPDGSARAAVARTDVFDSRRAWAELRRQVRSGPRPAGSPESRRLARRMRRELPAGRLERVAGGLVNVVGTVPGRRPAVVVGAHHDTKAMPGFVGANDGASGTAVVLELARVMRRARRPADAPELRFVLFDGEEATDESQPFYSSGLRGSRAYADRHRGELEAVVVLDMVGDSDLRIPREASSDVALWERLRAAARSAGTLRAFPNATRPTILDDHTPFLRAGIPAIDVIDFDFDCWHRLCDDASAVSERSLDTVGETVAGLLARWP